MPFYTRLYLEIKSKMIAHSAFHPHQKKLLTPNTHIPEIIPHMPGSFYATALITYYAHKKRASYRCPFHYQRRERDSEAIASAPEPV
jgi:hypothetical protein